MSSTAELEPDGLPIDQIGWFKVLGSVEIPGDDLSTLLVWHPFHHTRCSLTLFPGIDAIQHRALLDDTRKLRGIGHPGILPVLDVVESGGKTGLLVEGVGGYTLRDCLDEVGALELEEAVNIFRQILSGVASLHHHGLTHGDLRPENIQLDVSGDALVARLRGLGRASIERFNLHSPYLAPELSSGGDPSPRADVFALGCIFYECLAGQPPFTEIDPWSRRQAVRDSPPEPLQSRVERLPLEIAFAINSALKFHAGERFGTARAFARALPDGSRLHTEEIASPRGERYPELITGLEDDEAEPQEAESETLPEEKPEQTEERKSGSAPVKAAPAGASTARSAPSVPVEGGIGDRMAAAPVEAVIAGSRLLRTLAAPALATLFLVVLWNFNSARETQALRDEVEDSHGDLDPIFTRSLALADEAVTVGVEANQIRPLVARFESAEGYTEQVQTGHNLVTSMFRLVRSLRPSEDTALNQRRRSLEVQLNALDRDYAEYKGRISNLEEATAGSLAGRLLDMLR